MARTPETKAGCRAIDADDLAAMEDFDVSTPAHAHQAANGPLQGSRAPSV
jgi:hypothetical protein